MEETDKSTYLDETIIGNVMIGIHIILFVTVILVLGYGAMQLRKDLIKAETNTTDLGLKKVSISSHNANKETVIEMAPKGTLLESTKNRVKDKDYIRRKTKKMEMKHMVRPSSPHRNVRVKSNGKHSQKQRRKSTIV